MEKTKTKQLYIEKIAHPFEAVNKIFYETDSFEYFCQNKNFKLKKFIGSNWSIKDSGFIFFGPNNLNFAFSLINIEINDFCRVNKYLVTHINGEKIKNELIFFFSLIRNTSDNTTILEIRMEYNNINDLNDFENAISFSSIKTILEKSFCDIYNIFIDKRRDINKDFILVNHSFIIKKNYKEAFNFFYNFNNVAKSIKTDKVWKIRSENNKNNNNNYKDFFVIINDNVEIHNHVESIEERENEKIEIVFSKTSNSFPSLNNYIKLSFMYLASDISFFLYETHLPANISSSIYQTVSSYLYYCNKKSKDYIENTADFKRL
jgi:hypothetical protein